MQDLHLNDSHRVHYSVVVFFYNEQSNAAGVIQELWQAVSHWENEYEVIFVDDGSTDETGGRILAQIEEWPEARLIRLWRNTGQAAALWCGLRAVRGEVVILMEGDGQNDPRDIERLLSHLPEADLVVGTRPNHQGSPLRRFLSMLGNRARSGLLRDGIADCGCGLRVFQRDVIASFIPIQTLYAFMPALAMHAGHTVGQVRVNHRLPRNRESKDDLRRFLWRPVWDLIGVWWFLHRRCPSTYATTTRLTKMSVDLTA
jgi:glycosyltransferase involved in cell wall biosynthesis